MILSYHNKIISSTSSSYMLPKQKLKEDLEKMKSLVKETKQAKVLFFLESEKASTNRKGGVEVGS